VQNLAFKNFAFIFLIICLLTMNNETQQQARTQQKLEDILDDLCRLTGRDIFVILPEAKEERIPYLKKEIQKTLDLIK
tara:strand:+ start:291 stop:524 length:234 start_codon:yes stop_codon:yes gene_type:complete